MTTMVHETQQHYRKLIDLFSRPGEMEAGTLGIPNFTRFSDAVLATVLTLFDNEVSFSTIEQGDREEFMTLTGAKAAQNSEADFIVVKESELTAEMMETMKVGTLASPEKSATLIIEVEAIGSGHAYQLQGPGIKAVNALGMTLDPKWMALRDVRCAEFPIGIDLILVDRENHMTVIPRTTTVEVV
ncbi:phosphonate C-P lyase system protein PhnH [Salinicoccus cyprini]|uniref:Phosphonate C-P lyase system protein PhnH n=1 Tax=Salinicoccus cyprini TaxID=2493691 RepID=A0A558AXI9_9STAP|nr:phosphonate C-P lyase system protein PhnH [Salinicoccus cyprini]TVT28965.1 phosphonate C-P lyase system protein PhnH [Salinicoccus cyprini]